MGVEAVVLPRQSRRGPHYMLCKIGSRQHRQDLVENGTVYMQRWVVFKSLENRVQGDENEGLAMRFHSSNPTLRTSATIGSKTIDLGRASLVIHSPERLHGAYCMCCIQVPGNGTCSPAAVMLVASDPRILKGFGDTMVLFTNTPEFVRRLRRAARTAGYELESKPIRYMPMDHCGDMGPFRKLEDYRYQSEWRFLTRKPIPKKALILRLGSLLEIARWIDLNEVQGTTIQVADGPS